MRVIFGFLGLGNTYISLKYVYANSVRFIVYAIQIYIFIKNTSGLERHSSYLQVFSKMK